MNHRPGRWAKLLFLGFIVSVTVFAGWWIAKRVARTPSAATGSANQPVRAAGKRVVHVYFGDSGERHLVAERRVVENSGDDVALGRRLIELLVQGPNDGGSRTLPADARLRAFFIDKAGTAYVDFDAEAFTGHPGGAGAELLSIYAMVDTLGLNVDSVRSVKFLVGGHEAATLAGHVDIKEPFEIDMLWVR